MRRAAGIVAVVAASALMFGQTAQEQSGAKADPAQQQASGAAQQPSRGTQQESGAGQQQQNGNPAAGAEGQGRWRGGARTGGEGRRFDPSQMGSERFLGPILERSGDSLVVLRSDTGEKVKVAGAPDARMIKDQNMGAKLADFQVGDYVIVGGDMKDGAVEAKVLVSNSEQSKMLREDLGKTIVLGKVLSVDLDAATMKVRRVDGQEQTIQADEGSSFKRGRDESITMADIKAGDQIAARGAVKNGVFTVTQLNLMPRGMMMMGRGAGMNGRTGRQGEGGEGGGRRDQQKPQGQPQGSSPQ